jgi:hypothetical protein
VGLAEGLKGAELEKDGGAQGREEWHEGGRASSFCPLLSASESQELRGEWEWSGRGFHCW